MKFPKPEYVIRITESQADGTRVSRDFCLANPELSTLDDIKAYIDDLKLDPLQANFQAEVFFAASLEQRGAEAKPVYTANITTAQRGTLKPDMD